MRIGSLFSGAGGLDMAVESVFGGEIVWHAEIDKAASKVLAHRFPGVPNLGSVTDIDWATVPPVDVLCGGFPCTDVSAAGKRAGMHGTRSGLWSHMAEAIDVLRPRFVVIENVRGLLNANANRPLESAEDDLGIGTDRPVLRAIGAVLGDLADIGGYEARWVTMAAASVGAPHRRERVFIIARAADAKSDGWDGRPGDQLPVGTGDLRRVGGQGTTTVGDGSGLHAANSSRYGWDEGRAESAGIVGGFDVAVSGAEPGVALLPTPTTQDGANNGGPSQFERNTLPLNAEVTLLATPQSRDYKGRPADGYNQANLCRDVALLCTPSVADSSGGHLSRSGEKGSALLLPTPKAHDGEFGTPRTSGRPIEKSTHLGTIASLEQTNHWGKYEPAIRRWEQIVGPAPSPTEPNKNGNPRLSAAFSEWMMGWPAGWVTDPDIGISRNDQLRIVGNGVCPQQAIAALRYLLAVTA